jgi:DNA-binding Lrp family transcriptional regulator
MVHAVIMVEAGTAQSTDILDPIRELAGVLEAHVVAGDYDIIVEFEAGEVYEVLEAASSSIQGIEGVADTRTYVSLD